MCASANADIDVKMITCDPVKAFSWICLYESRVHGEEEDEDEDEDKGEGEDGEKADNGKQVCRQPEHQFIQPNAINRKRSPTSKAIPIPI